MAVATLHKVTITMMTMIMMKVTMMMTTTVMMKVTITLVSDSEKEGHRKRCHSLPLSNLSQGLFDGHRPVETHLDNRDPESGRQIMARLKMVRRDFGDGR